MKTLITRLWRDERGFVHSAELLLIATIVIVGAIVGLASLRDSVTSELDDTAKAVGGLNQSYRVAIESGCIQCGDEVAVDFGTDTVTIQVTENLNFIRTVATFKNFKYDDGPDFGEFGPPIFVDGGTELDPAPTPIP